MTNTSAHFFFYLATKSGIYTLSLHDALPICRAPRRAEPDRLGGRGRRAAALRRSEEHTSELQSQFHAVCRLLLEKKNNLTQRVHKPSLTSKLILQPWTVIPSARSWLRHSSPL